MKKNVSVDLPPAWFVSNLADLEKKSAAVPLRHEYMKKDFIHSVTLARKKLNFAKTVLDTGRDAIFSLHGAIIDLCEQVLRLVIPSTSAIATRSGNREEGRQGRQLLGGFNKPVAGGLLQVATILSDGQIWLQLNLLHPESGLEVRPFSLEIRDKDENLLQDWLEVMPGMLPPIFSSPQPGVYCCTVVWTDGKAVTEFEFAA